MYSLSEELKEGLKVLGLFTLYILGLSLIYYILSVWFEVLPVMF